MDVSTKMKIVNAAVDRFNRFGLANVPMQQIAEDVGMSPGNLAYHFRTKEALIERIFSEVFSVVDEMQQTFRVYPNLLDLDLQLNKYLKIIKKFPFYFSDIVEIRRHYPSLMDTRKNHIDKLISQIEERLRYNAQRGIIEKEQFDGHYINVAESIWMLITFYPAREMLLHPERPNIIREDFMEKVWLAIKPYFTDKGLQEYNTLIAPLLNGDSIKH